MSGNVGIVPQQEEIPLTDKSKRIWYIIGWIISAIGGITCLTIIFFLIGFPILVVGLIIVALAAPTKEVTCPECSSERNLVVGTKYLRCKNCGTKTLLHWKPRKSLSD